jgi:hypothetical protein
MFEGHVGHWRALRALLFIGGLPLALGTACENDDVATGLGSLPAAVTVQTAASRDTLTVSWNLAQGATGYRVELAGAGDLSKVVGPADGSVTFTPADGLADGVTYAATVYALSSAGETASSNTAQVPVNFFPWDEYYPTSLHRTGQGKQTFYNAAPNGGFETLTAIPYNDLVCQGCHTPGFGGTVKGERGCQSCHETDDPQLGAQVDATLTGVCGPCHSRQKAEAFVHQYSDVHRDAGMDCMACHTLEDVHGDGNEYDSMLDPGAIDSKCSDCHVGLANNVYHSTHAGNIDCSACHIQSVVTCNNCHFESEVEVHQKIAYGQFKDWKFLVNKDGKIHIGNYQSVTHQGNAVVAFGPYYAHTIARDAISGCGDCHGNEAVTDWHEDGVIDLVVWDPAGNAPNGKNLTYQKGIIPVPPNFTEGGLRYDFVTLDQPGGSQWSFVKTGADIYQILYATPLTQAQMDKLKN